MPTLIQLLASAAVSGGVEAGVGSMFEPEPEPSIGWTEVIIGTGLGLGAGAVVAWAWLSEEDTGASEKAPAE